MGAREGATHLPRLIDQVLVLLGLLLVLLRHDRAARRLSLVEQLVHVLQNEGDVVVELLEEQLSALEFLGDLQLLTLELLFLV